MNFFISFIGMSGQASIVIGVVLLLRFLFKKINVSKKYVMLLWMIPFMCLVIPWKINSPVGFWSSSPAEYTYENMMKTNEKTHSNHINVKNNDTNVSTHIGMNINVNGEKHINMKANSKKQTNTNKNTLEQVLSMAMVMWGVVVGILYVYSVIAYGKLKKQLSKCIKVRRRVFFVDDIPVPMVVGMFQPKIYIPSGIEREHIKYVVAHEETHIKRNDMIVKLMAYCITCIHWFNPLVWISYDLMVKDMEMACDEETILRLGQEKRKEYATALLQLSTGTRNVFAIPLAFGEGSTKARIKNIVKFKKTKQILAVAAVVIGVVIAVVFMTKAENKVEGPTEKNQISELSEEKNMEVETVPNKDMEKEVQVQAERHQQELDIMEKKAQEEMKQFQQTLEETEKKTQEEMKQFQQTLEETKEKTQEEIEKLEQAEKEMDESQTLKASDTEVSEGADITQMWIKEQNMLTEEQIQWFETSFFNGRDKEGVALENYITNMFLATEYDRPENIDLSLVFYGGTESSASSVDYGSKEKQMLEERYQISDVEAVRIPVEGMNRVLQKYMNITLEETNKIGLDYLYYLKEYETYYNVAGDTMWMRYDILSGWVNQDGTITLQYGCKDTDWIDTKYLVTLREENGSYYFLSNVKE